MTAVVNLRNLTELQRAIVRLGWRMEKALRNAAWTAARWGEARVTRATMGRRIIASQTFARGWLSRKVADGAIIANSAKHAYFVERGRRRGKMPPLPAIEEWLKLKRITAKVPPLPKPRVTGNVRAGQARGTGGRYAASQRVRLQKIAKQHARFARADTTRAYRQRLALKMMALNIARKIGRRGTRGKFVLGSLMRAIGLRYRGDIRRELAKITASPPR